MSVAVSQSGHTNHYRRLLSRAVRADGFGYRISDVGKGGSGVVDDDCRSCEGCRYVRTSSFPPSTPWRSGIACPTAGMALNLHSIRPNGFGQMVGKEQGEAKEKKKKMRVGEGLCEGCAPLLLYIETAQC